MISHCYDVICYPISTNSQCLKTLGVDSLQDIGEEIDLFISSEISLFPQSLVPLLDDSDR